MFLCHIDQVLKISVILLKRFSNKCHLGVLKQKKKKKKKKKTKCGAFPLFKLANEWATAIKAWA